MFNKRAGGFYRGTMPNEFPFVRKSNISRVQKFSSLRTPLTEEDMASCFRAFRKPKNPEEEWKLIENGTPKATIALKKYSLKKKFWDSRMVRD